MAKKHTYKISYGYQIFPIRRKLKPEGEYTALPIGDPEVPFKYTLWDFVSDITKNLLDKLHFGR